MIILTYTISILLMLLLPVALVILLHRRFRAPWLLLIVGVLTFAGLQAVHLPLNHWLSEIGVLPASGTLAVWNQADLAAEAEYIGTLGSPTIVSGLDEAASRERKRIILEGSVDEQVARLVKVLVEVV